MKKMIFVLCTILAIISTAKTTCMQNPKHSQKIPAYIAREMVPEISDAILYDYQLFVVLKNILDALREAQLTVCAEDYQFKDEQCSSHGLCFKIQRHFPDGLRSFNINSPWSNIASQKKFSCEGQIVDALISTIQEKNDLIKQGESNITLSTKDPSTLKISQLLCTPPRPTTSLLQKLISRQKKAREELELIYKSNSKYGKDAIAQALPTNFTTVLVDIVGDYIYAELPCKTVKHSENETLK